MSFARGDLIWVNFSPQKGHEQAGRRPALVISPAEYNALCNCLILCPITSNTEPWPWKVRLEDGLPVVGAVLVDQVKSVDTKARKAEAVGAAASAETLQNVLALLKTLVA